MERGKAATSILRGFDQIRRVDRSLPLTLSFVPSSAISSPFLFRHVRCLENDITLVSRARVDGPAGAADFRAAAGGGVAEAPAAAA